MPRIDLAVPFAEKDEAKRLGARWDGERKTWYVPDGIDVRNFRRWVPSEPYINVRSNSYFIAQTIEPCWKCGEYTSVYGFILPAGHETLEPGDDEVEDEWSQYDQPTIIFYINNLLPAVEARIKAFSRHYHIDFSKTIQSSYWMNHCEYCDTKQGDFMLYCEPEGAFYPIDKHAASLIVLYEFAEPFACSGSMAYGEHLLHFFEYMQRT